MNVVPTGPRQTAGASPDVPRGPFIQLTMYKERPSGEISIEEFEKYALDRLRVLKAIEEARLRSKNDDIIQADVQTLWQKHMTCTSRQESWRKDVLSHHILRLAYCRTADLRAWLLQHEALLFKYRFRELTPANQADFFTSMDLPYHAISESELEELTAQLAAVALSVGDSKAYARIMGRDQVKQVPGTGLDLQRDMVGRSRRPTFYKVPFQAVPDLVGSRRVLLKGGLAYVAEDQVYSLVVGSFRSCLSAALVEAARAWGLFAAAEADRLAPLVDSLPSRSVGSSDGRKVPVGEVSAGQLAGLVAGRHFPLCMSVMYERLAAEHHLKHWGLQQFSLFLKAIGLPLEQALLFFRQQFSPRTSGDKFTKEYAYNIRYNYGQEGKRENWSEWSCVKIINQEVGGACSAPCECNGGCPYKTFDANQLRAALSRLNCNEKMIKDVIDKAKGKHYQLACGLAYEGITGAPQDTGINKPSEYYAASIELAKEQAAAEGSQQAAAVGAGAGNGIQQSQHLKSGPPCTPVAGRAAAQQGLTSSTGTAAAEAAAAAETPR